MTRSHMVTFAARFVFLSSCAGSQGEQPGKVEDSAPDGGDERDAASAQTGKCAGGRPLDFGACAVGHVRLLAFALGRGISVGRLLLSPRRAS